MVWTDVFQAVVMIAGFLIVIIKGSRDLGGFAEIWRICDEHGRVDFIQ